MNGKVAIELKSEDTINERKQLEQAIAALEAQRTVLGDAVVDTAVGPLKQKLEDLAAADLSSVTRWALPPWPNNWIPKPGQAS
jgi:hypothetical protein